MAVPDTHLELELTEKDFIPARIDQVAEGIRRGSVVNISFQDDPDERILQVIASAIPGTGKFGVRFNIRGYFDGTEVIHGYFDGAAAAIALSQAIARGTSTSDLSIWMSDDRGPSTIWTGDDYRKISHDGVDALASAITKSKGKLLLDLAGCNLDERDARVIAEAIRNANALSLLDIDLSNNTFLEKRVRGYPHSAIATLSALMSAAGSIRAPRNLTLRLKVYDYSLMKEELLAIGAAISSKQAPQKLKLRFNWIEAGIEDAGAELMLFGDRGEGLKPIVQAIETENCPPGLDLIGFDKKIKRPVIQDHQALHKSRALGVFTLLCINQRTGRPFPIELIAIMARFIMPGWWSGPRVPENGRGFIRRIGQFFPDTTTAKPEPVARDPDRHTEEPTAKKSKLGGG